MKGFFVFGVVAVGCAAAKPAGPATLEGYLTGGDMKNATVEAIRLREKAIPILIATYPKVADKDKPTCLTLLGDIGKRFHDKQAFDFLVESLKAANPDLATKAGAGLMIYGSKAAIPSMEAAEKGLAGSQMQRMDNYIQQLKTYGSTP